MYEQIIKEIKKSGNWYNTNDHEVYSGPDFAQQFNVPSAINATRIQRQFDGYAIEGV